MLHWLLQHCQSTGFNESFSYRVIDCDLIIEPLMEMIGGVWREQNEAFFGLADAHTSKVAPGICNLPSGAPVPIKCTDTPWLCLWGCENNRFSSFFYSFLLTSTCVELPIEWCPPVPHLILVPSFSFMHSLSDLFQSALSFFVLFLLFIIILVFLGFCSRLFPYIGGNHFGKK